MLRLLFLFLLLVLSSSAIAADCSDAERAAYLDAVRRDIRASWKVPYEDASISCTVLIKQDFRGEVENVGLGRCGDDRAILISVINAGYRASPMPLPENRACFSRDVIVTLTYTPLTG